MKHLVLLVLILSSSFIGLRAEESTSKLDNSDFSQDGLAKLTTHFQTYVDDGKLAGLTTLIAHRGKLVHFQTYGQQNKEAAISTSEDTLFRIYSMTKPVTGVAMMMLWEEGKFKLDDPVSKYLPSFKNQNVYASVDEKEIIQTMPIKREATIRDLMRHTAGLTYGLFGDTPVDKSYQNDKLFDSNYNLEGFVKALGKQPLLYQPGEDWVYSLSVDVQGRLIEVLSGKPLDTFFNERIFKPLSMLDTGFQVRKDQLDQFSELYNIVDEVGLTPYRGKLYQDFTQLPDGLSGGAGLLSTTTDYWKFAQMVANGGVLDGVRLLKSETVALMSKDQLPSSVNGIADGKKGLGFGLNFAVVKDVEKNGKVGRVGEYFWGGVANTIFWIDPEEDIVVILMTNILPIRIYPLRNEMREYVYGALKKQK